MKENSFNCISRDNSSKIPLESFMDNTNTNISRNDKIKALRLNMDSNISDEELDRLYNIFILKKEDEIPKSNVNDAMEVLEKKQLKHGDPKYELLLEVLNAVLLKIGMNKITEITDFKKIMRDDIISDNCKDIIDTYLERIADVKMFGRTSIQYSKRHIIKTYLFTLIKKMVNECGYKLKKTRKDLGKSINGVTDHDWRSFYTII